MRVGGCGDGATGSVSSVVRSPGAADFAARFAARRSIFSRAFCLSFISRSRFAKEGRWLDTDYSFPSVEGLRPVRFRPGGLAPWKWGPWTVLPG